MYFHEVKVTYLFSIPPHHKIVPSINSTYLLYLFSSMYSKYPRPWSSRGLFTPLFFSPGFCSVLPSPVTEAVIYFDYFKVILK